MSLLPQADAIEAFSQSFRQPMLGGRICRSRSVVKQRRCRHVGYTFGEIGSNDSMAKVACIWVITAFAKT